MSTYTAELSPEMAEAVAAVCRQPATKIVMESTHLNLDVVSNSLYQIWVFLRQNCGNIGELEYLLELQFIECPTHAKQLDTQYILECLQKGANVIQINHELRTIGISSIELLSGPEISNYSKVQQCCVIHVINGSDFCIYYNGLTIKEMNVNSPFSQALSRKKFSRQASDYKLAIIDHYKGSVRFAQDSPHWDPPGNREKRVLYGKGRTEMIFHRDLWKWLDDNLNASVYGMVNKLSSDQTDIEIRAREPLFFILEVKWLGTNSSKTTHSWDRLKGGITQVKNYLDTEPQCLEACLVTYDGRKIEEFRKLEECDGEVDQWKEFRRCDTKEFPPKGKGLLFFLESETASRRTS